MIELLTYGVAHRFRDRSRMHHDVRVGKEQVLARRLPGGKIESVIFAEPARREFRKMNRSQSPVAFGQRREYLARSISRAIIDDDDFQFRVILMQDGLQCFFDVAFFVSRRDDDGNLGP